MLLAITLFIGALMVFSLFIKPAYAEISALRSELAAKKGSYDQYQTSLSQLKGFVKGSDQDMAQLQNSISRILPKDKDAGYLSAQVLGFAKVNRLQVKSMSMQVEPIKASKLKSIRSIGTLRADAVMSGGYGDFKNFVRQLEQNLLMIDIDSIKISQENKSEAEKAFAPSLVYSVSIISYYQTQ